ncbi:hypothetical protein [Colwellia sp. MT41]|uniref:hypothetical protein n=1 Tax=Colwellia sp. MT41 TaxID=58049 RepID=UPI0012FA3FC0|nr:hypothetical protein [Colwellia sp. MT41]
MNFSRLTRPVTITDSFIVHQLALFNDKSNRLVFIVLLMAIMSIGMVWLINVLGDFYCLFVCCYYRC